MAEILLAQEATRLQELETTISHGLQTFVEVGNAIREIRDSRLYREQYATFEEYCRARWGWSKTHANRQIQAANTAEILTPMGVTLENERQARALAPLTKDKERLLELYDAAEERYGPQQVTPDRVLRLAEKRFKRVEREEEARKRTEEQPPIREIEVGGAEIRHCDFRDLDLPDASVDLIFTDPPYPGEYLHLWKDLSYFAALALKPSGLLVAYSGQYHLPTVIGSLGHNLEYLWTGTVVTPGLHNQVQGRKVRSAAKPLLFYRCPDSEADCNWIDDAFVSEGREKEHHEWQQSLGAARYYIEKLTSAGDVVVDPFLGSGTTAVACKELERSFIGCDLDQGAVLSAGKRLAA